jgi:hypothetical protein
VDREVVQRQRRAHLEGHVAGQREDHVGIGGHHLGEATQPGQRGHPVARRQPRPLGCRADHAGDLAAGDERGRRLDLVLAAAEQRVGEGDARRDHVHDHPAVAGGLRDVADLDRSRPVKPRHPRRTHARTLAVPAPAL